LPPGIVRVSVGIEDAEDLWRDLHRALRPRGTAAPLRGAAPTVIGRVDRTATAVTAP
jgi:hypothetical protein